VLHFPGDEKKKDFKETFTKKIEDNDFDFRGVWFPDKVHFAKFEFTAAVNFNDATFSAEVDFTFTTFSTAASFSCASFIKGVHFGGARFRADADFSGAIFGAEAGFYETNFSGKADFNSAKFRAGANFSSAAFSGEAEFSGTDFSAKADFNDASFSEMVHFNNAIFSAGADFSDTWFRRDADFTVSSFMADADFRAAIFSAEAFFNDATFHAEAAFSDTRFDDHVRFAGSERKPVFDSGSSFGLQFARIQKPDYISFHTLTLRPHWFVNVDPRKFEFTNVDWKWCGINEEIASLKEIDVSSPYHMLAIACRHLAVNAEENHRYQEASRFRYMAMDAKRLGRWRGADFRRLSWWYWLASGYSERVLRAFMVLMGIMLISAALYTHVGFCRWEPRIASEADLTITKRDEVGAPLTLSRALHYSAAVITLQRPEPRPATTAAQTIVLLESIVGPVQAALMALAIRRKFMR
jgi:hypothetical protein